ncbi:hypothetical protein [Paraburkholderia susongensis]|uniref:hypothetical protein n=1 Tax=Paraburkholderia susongensis TaxID=1515439 RepID=UPI00117FE1DF|nr:hypothetical protein [Paraburkholderia susongensis]
MTVPYPVPVSSTRPSGGEVLLLDPNPWKRLPKGAKKCRKNRSNYAKAGPYSRLLDVLTGGEAPT